MTHPALPRTIGAAALLLPLLAGCSSNSDNTTASSAAPTTAAVAMSSAPATTTMATTAPATTSAAAPASPDEFAAATGTPVESTACKVMGTGPKLTKITLTDRADGTKTMAFDVDGDIKSQTVHFSAGTRDFNQLLLINATLTNGQVTDTSTSTVSLDDLKESAPTPVQTLVKYEGNTVTILIPADQAPKFALEASAGKMSINFENQTNCQLRGDEAPAPAPAPAAQ